MAGERQTEPHQAENFYWRAGMWHDNQAWVRQHEADAALARVRAERDEARKCVDAAEARIKDFQRRWNEAQDFIRDKQWDDARTDTDVVAEIVALIRSYADVHMTKALADLIEHKYGAGSSYEA